MTPELVVLGNLLLDDMVFPDGRTRMAEPGGATLYAGLAASLWGLRAGVASVRGDDYPAWALSALAARGVDLAGVAALGGPGIRTWLLYEGARRQVVHRLDRPTHARVSPAPGGLPPAWRGAGAFHLAPMPFDVQRDLVAALSPLEGPMKQEVWDRVLDESVILHGGERYAWTIPLAFPVSDAEARAIRPGSGVAVTREDGELVAIVDDVEVFDWDKPRYVKIVYGTDRFDHPVEPHRA